MCVNVWIHKVLIGVFVCSIRLIRLIQDNYAKILFFFFFLFNRKPFERNSPDKIVVFILMG